MAVVPLDALAAGKTRRERTDAAQARTSGAFLSVHAGWLTFN